MGGGDGGGGGEGGDGGRAGGGALGGEAPQTSAHPDVAALGRMSAVVPKLVDVWFELRQVVSVQPKSMFSPEL